MDPEKTDGQTEDQDDEQEDSESIADDAKGKSASGKTYSQDEFNAAFDKRWAKEKAKLEKAQRDADAAKEAKDLEEQGEFRKLYEAEQAKVTELAPKAAEHDAALEVVQRLVDAKLSAAPDYVQVLLKDMSPVQQLDYLQEHESKWAASADEDEGDTRESIQRQPKTKTGKTTAGQAFLQSHYGVRKTDPATG